MVVDVSTHTIEGNGAAVTAAPSDEMLRLECLHVAVAQGVNQQDECLVAARAYYAFVKEVSGSNVIDAARSFARKRR